MRNLKSTDLFAALRVVKEIGIKEEMKEFAQALQKGSINAKTQREIGVELILGILGNAGSPSAEMAVFRFLSGPMEIPVEDLREMDLLEFGEKVSEFAGSIDIEAWKAFFTSLVGQMKKNG